RSARCSTTQFLISAAQPQRGVEDMATASAVPTRQVVSEHARKLESLLKFRPNVEFSLDGMIVNANELFLKLTGYTAEDLVGQTHDLFVPPEERQTAAVIWQKVAQGYAETGEYKRVGRGGKEMWVSTTYYPILDAHG